MHYSALFLDIDDTLIGKDKKISANNLAAIFRARAAGKLVTVATGRGYLGASEIWKAMDIQGPVIVYGGAMIMDTRDNSVIYSADIEPALISEALACAHQWGAYAQIYQGDTVIYEKETEFSRYYTNVMHLPYKEDPALREKIWRDVPKVLIYVPVEKEAETAARFKGHFQGRLEVACSRPGFVELNKHNVHKGSAILYLADMLGIPQGETIAIGDNTLDLEMIRMAGLGLCVENGQQVVKDAADAVIPACEADGVAYAIAEYLLKEESV